MPYFDATTTEPSTDSFAPLPNGKYRVQISAIEERTSQASGNKYVKVEYTVLEGTCTGRKLWSNINLFHAKPDVRSRAQADFSALCRAVGVLRPEGLHDLKDRTLLLPVRVGKNKETGEPENKLGVPEADAGPGAVAATRAAATQPTAGKWAPRPAAA